MPGAFLFWMASSEITSLLITCTNWFRGRGMSHSVLVMGVLRVLSGAIELTAAILILLFNDLKTAMMINAILAVIGPLILLITMTAGLIGLAGELSFGKIILIILGVVFILIGTLS